MTLLGGNDDRNIRGNEQSVPHNNEDTSVAPVSYVFQRTQGNVGSQSSGVHGVHETSAAEYAAHFTQKQSRWACSDEHTLDNPDKWKYNPPINAPNAIPGVQCGGPSIVNRIDINSGMGSMSANCGLLPSIGGGPMTAMQQAAAVAKHNQMLSQVATASVQQQPSHQVHHQQSHSQHVAHTSSMTSQQFSSNLLNNTMNNPATAALAASMAHMHLNPNIQGSNIYDHQNVHASVSINGMGGPKHPPQGQHGPGDLVYLGGQSHAAALGIITQNPFINNQQALGAAVNHTAAAITTSTAKKLWEKSDSKSSSSVSGPLNTLHIGDPQVWKDSPWSTQGEIMLPRSRTFTQPSDVALCNNAGILSPRDATSGLGVKMVEYVLRGSPTNKDSPLSSLEPRIRSLKFDDNDKSDDEQENANSPFEATDKKDEQLTNGAVNNIDDDKAFNRTPGSRQPSPAEEPVSRPPLLDPIQHGVFPPFNHHMISGGSTMDHTGNAIEGPSNVMGNQLNASFPHQMSHINQLQPQIMNGVSGMHMSQSSMLNHQGQTSNQMDPGSLLQQQAPNFDVQLFTDDYSIAQDKSMKIKCNA